jgi:endonuclease/exonuclease/phosphatase family metal-dependent hydrolase
MDILRLCTWNIKQGQYLPIVLKEISNQKDFSGLDLLAVQESFVHNQIEDAEKIAKILGPQYNYYQENVRIQFGLLQGNALIWNTERIKIKNKSSFFLPDVYGKHLPRWEKMLFRFIPKQDRNCLVLEGSFKNKTIRIYVTHLDVLGFNHKRAQLNAIFEHDMVQSPVDLCIVVGDFNTFKFVSRPSWKNLAEDAREAGFTDLTTEIFWTFSRRRVRFKQKLDSVFIKPFDFKYKSWSLDIKGSDHIPVFTTIEIINKKSGNKRA